MKSQSTPPAAEPHATHPSAAPRSATRPSSAPIRRQDPARRARSTDAIVMLAAEHVEIDAMFERLLHGRLDAARRHALVQELCMTLRIHLLLEEEIFYPAVKRAVGPLAHIDRSHAQHDAAKPLLAQLMAMRPGDPQGDATIAQLADYVRTHQAEEKNELFPRVRASGLSMRGLGEQMRARRRALLSATVVFGEVLTTSL